MLLLVMGQRVLHLERFGFETIVSTAFGQEMQEILIARIPIPRFPVFGSYFESNPTHLSLSKEQTKR